MNPKANFHGTSLSNELKPISAQDTSSGRSSIRPACRWSALTTIKANSDSTVADYKNRNVTIELSPGCPWYDSWIAEQLLQQPKDVFCILKNATSGKSVIQDEQFLAIWSEILLILSRKCSNSIDGIVEELLARKLLEFDAHSTTSTHEFPSHARYLVFAIIGWQTMLFRPDKLSYPTNCFGIVDETNGFRGHRHTQLFQPDSAYGKPLHELLLGFGLMLPPKDLQTNSAEDKAKGRSVFNSKSFNAYLLTTICDIQLVWTDSLACHLEFDPSANMLYIFKYPSFCAANWHASKDHTRPNDRLHACARPIGSDAWWATVEDVDLLLMEVLLSYRILFGMEKVGRKFFRRNNPFLGAPQFTKDRMLEEICARKRPCLDIPLAERNNFDLARDFPILRDRLTPLLNALSTAKPHTIRQLWKDRRDSSTWSAFWVIIFIGVGGLLLALIQVVLQIVQIVLQSS